MPINQVFYRQFLYNLQEDIKMITTTQIQQRIAEAIRQSGLTQTELAKKLNIKQPTLAQYLSGRALPALDTFANLCAVLDVDPSYILCLID